LTSISTMFISMSIISASILSRMQSQTHIIS
jgi:hypothetical protein